ncbi:hypothetical protein [Novosphingobium sp. PhB55]|jgi:hypothetical protein|uniref:hypothetical protein n=1 Tax=Novosphingobium sp. PhB55 TaxID=2485106 RepID=UPI001416EFE9|nr:hypothetical protein [Novosphingobium sp. PhB55]
MPPFRASIPLPLGIRNGACYIGVADVEFATGVANLRSGSEIFPRKNGLGRFPFN